MPISMRDFKPSYAYAQQYGCKSLVYGKPGTGKTPIFATAPRPLLAFSEPGMLSMRKTNIPCIDIFTPERTEDFAAWLEGSAEAKNFDSIGWDSFSQTSEIYLERELGGKSKAGNQVDGKAAYGKMSRAVQKLATQLYYMQRKHVYLICKEEVLDIGNTTSRRPYFPGKELNVKIPHLYDLIMHLEMATIPGVVGPVKAFRTAASFDCVARDRSGQLDEFEPPDLTRIFAKTMQ